MGETYGLFAFPHHAPYVMKTRSVALLVLCLTAGVAEAQKVEVPFRQFTLDNGLTVILHRDPSTPLINSNLWYHVGSAFEKPRRTGFAHLFEHIMFEGSTHVPEGKIDEWFEEVGGSPNGSTNTDRTNYMQTFSRNALDLALFIESDRMGFLLEAMSPASVDGQRDVVKNERRQSYENRPYGMAWQVLGEHLFPPEHPYHWPVIGYMEDLSAASYDDVVSFFKSYYTPNNATLVLAGDLDLDEAQARVAYWFGAIPAGPAVAPLQAPRPMRDQEARIVMEDRVQLPRLYMAWVTPPAFAPGNVEADVLGELLAGGKNARLYKRLVYEMQIAQDVFAFQNTGALASQFFIVATARKGHTLDELRTAIDAEIATLMESPPAERELLRVVNQTETAFLEQLEQLSAKANQLNEYFYYAGNPDYFNEDLGRYRALSPADVSTAARRLLRPGDRVLLSIVPGGMNIMAVPGSAPVFVVSPAGE